MRACTLGAVRASRQKSARLLARSGRASCGRWGLSWVFQREKRTRALGEPLGEEAFGPDGREKATPQARRSTGQDGLGSPGQHSCSGLCKPWLSGCGHPASPLLRRCCFGSALPVSLGRAVQKSPCALGTSAELSAANSVISSLA